MTDSNQKRARGVQPSSAGEQEPIVNPNGRADIAGSMPDGQGGDVDKAFGPGQGSDPAPSGVAVNAGRGSDDGPLGIEVGDLGAGSISGGLAGGLGGGLDSSDVGGASTGMQNDLGTDLQDASVGDQANASEPARHGGSHDMARGEKGSGRAQVAPDQRPGGRKPPKQ